jgi:Flp pilus assembly protein RcpC/CpaB
VFAVNDVTTTQTNDPRDPEKRSFAGGKTVSLLVTPEQAEMVTLASSLGVIRLILRGAEDKATTKVRPMVARDLLGSWGVSDRSKEGKAPGESGIDKLVDGIKKALAAATASKRPAAAQLKEPERFTMRLLAGPDRTDVLMLANADAAAMPGDDGAWTIANLPTANKPMPPIQTAAPSIAAPTAPANPQTKPQNNEKQLPSLKVNGTPPLGG